MTLAPTEDLFPQRQTVKDNRTKDDKRPQTTRVCTIYTPREGHVCKYADQNALVGGATPPPWSAIGRAKRGREPILIRISAQTDLTYTRLEAGQSGPTLAHWTEEKGA